MTDQRRVHFAAFEPNDHANGSEFRVLRTEPNKGEDPNDPIEISDSEDAPRRPRRSAQAYSVWYGRRRRRASGGIEPGDVSNNTKSVLRYILEVLEIVCPIGTLAFRDSDISRQNQVNRLLEQTGQWRQMRIPTPQNIRDHFHRYFQERPPLRVAVNLANRVEMS